MTSRNPRFYALVLGGLVAGSFACSGEPQAVGPDAERLRIAFVGQSLIREDIRTLAPLAVEQARTYLAGADVAFTNLEVAVAPESASVTPRPGVTPTTPDVLDALSEMGFNLLSTANNHALDLGMEGVRTTLSELDARGLVHAGTGADQTDAAKAGILDTSVGKVALVAMASGSVQLTPDTWADVDRAGVNFLELREDGALNPEQRSRILSAVKAAAAEAPIVIAYHHNHYWGEARGSDGPPGRELRIDRFTTPQWMEQWARELIDAGADIYVAHGNPALHGVEVHNGGLILYGLGNYIFHTKNPIDRYGPMAWYSAVVDVELERYQLESVRFRPLALAMGGDAKGTPYLAQGGEADLVLERLSDVSRPYGTEIEVHDGWAEVVLNRGRKRR